MQKLSFTTNMMLFLSVIVSLALSAFFFRADLFPKKLERVTMGGSHSINISLILIALDRGFFAQEGIELMFKEYTSAKLALDDVCERQLDLAIVAETPVVFKSFERDDVRILASLFSAYNDPKVIARKSSGIEFPQDLRGKHIGTTKQGQSAHYFLHLFLTKYGLSDQDVRLSFASPDALKHGLANGEFDALALFEPHISEVAHALSAETVVFSEPQLYFKRAVLVSLDNFPKERPRTVQRILRAFTRANEFARQQPEDAMQIVAKGLSLSVPDVRTLWEEAILDVSLEQSLLLTLENEAKWALDNQFTDSEVMPNYVNMIYFDGLNAVEPESVTIYH